MSRGPGKLQQLLLTALEDHNFIVPTEWYAEHLGVEELSTAQYQSVLRAARGLVDRGLAAGSSNTLMPKSLEIDERPVKEIRIDTERFLDRLTMELEVTEFGIDSMPISHLTPEAKSDYIRDLKRGASGIRRIIQRLQE